MSDQPENTILFNVNEFVDYMKQQGLVLVKMEVDNHRLDAVKIDKLRIALLDKPALSINEIVSAELWGKIGKQTVYNIIKTRFTERQVKRAGGHRQIKVPMKQVRLIAEERNQVWPLEY